MNTISYAELHKALNLEKAAAVHLDVFEQLPSTNAYMLDTIRDWQASAARTALGAALPDPWLCIANEQTQGSGRRGKLWHTQAGEITFSYFCRLPKPPSALLGLSLVTGISVANALQRVADIHVALKWPNDIVVNGRKLCGLLTELVDSRADNASYVVSGIGINYQPWDHTKSGLLQANSLPPVSIMELTNSAPGRASLVAAVVVEMQKNYARFINDGWQSFAIAWQSRDYLKGKSVTIHNGDQREAATALGVDEQGALIVQCQGGVKTVFSGDVSVRVS